MTTTADVRDYLMKQLTELGGLSDFKATLESDREQVKQTIAIAEATARVAKEYTELVKTEVIAARVLNEHGATSGAIALVHEENRKLS